MLDDCNFHDCVKLDEYESAKTLNFVPPDGEFVVMNYTITSDFRAPFKIFPFLEELSTYAPLQSRPCTDMTPYHLILK